VAVAVALASVAGVASAAENVHEGLADPATVAPGETVQPHKFSYVVEDVSNDGSSDELYVTFPDEVPKENLSSYAGDVTDEGTGESVSVSSSMSIVDGPDGDGVQETLKIGVQPEGERATRDLVVNFTGGQATWPEVDATTDYPMKASVIDSGGPNVDLVDVATVTVEVESEETDPAVSTGSTSSVGTSSATLEGQVTDLGGADSVEVWFAYWQQEARSSTEATTSRQTVSSATTFTAEAAGLDPGTDHEFEAHLEAGSATDTGAPSAFATDAEEAPAKQLLAGTSQPSRVNASQDVQHVVNYTVSEVSNDGSSVELFLTFPDRIHDDRLSSFSGQAEDADTGDPVSISSSVSIVDGPDGDGVQETVKVGVQPAGDADRIDLNVTFTGTVSWPQPNRTVEMPLEAAVHDATARDLDPPTEFAVVTVQVDDEPTSDGEGQDEADPAADEDEGAQDETETTDGGASQAPQASGPQWTFGTVRSVDEEDCPVAGCWEMALGEIDPDGGDRQVGPARALVWTAERPAARAAETGSDPWTLSLHCTEQAGGSVEIALATAEASGEPVDEPAAADTVTVPTERCEGEDSPVRLAFEPPGDFVVAEDERPVVRFDPVDNATITVHAKPDQPDTRLTAPESLAGYADASEETPWPGVPALAAVSVAAVAARRSA